uniref:Sucrose-6-phosphate hydrolase n=1 Tax=Acrobeloides nanus TaxID=290746 RepID=A0A914DPI6_9BILA
MHLIHAIFLVLLVGIFDENVNGDVTNNRYRLNYHIQPPSGWMNDPDGLSYFNGQYHVFYQYNPYSSNWGAPHWGHVASTDLVHWKNLPIALTPGDPYDKDGCFSGSAVVNGNELVLVYTGNVNTANGFTQTQNIATSKDGVTFTKYSGNPVLANPPVDGTKDFRDPKVWLSIYGSQNGTWNMVVGNPSVAVNNPYMNSYGRVVLYQSNDLKTWTYLGGLAEEQNAEQNLGYMWDDPNFFYLNGKYVLLVSPAGIERDIDRFANLNQNGYFIGDYRPSTNLFSRGQFYELDNGHDFFAAHVFEDPTGRRIVIGWMQMWGSWMREQVDGWAGALTIPRELSLSSDGTRLQMAPVAELTSLRGSQYINSPINVNGEYDTNIPIGSSEVLFDVVLAGVRARKVGLKFPIDDGELELYYDTQNQTLVLSRNKDIRQVAISNISVLNLRIFLDRSSIEVFANNGTVTMTSRFYVDWIPIVTLFTDNGESGAARVNVQAFSLNNIW